MGKTGYLPLFHGRERESNKLPKLRCCQQPPTKTSSSKKPTHTETTQTLFACKNTQIPWDGGYNTWHVKYKKEKSLYFIILLILFWVQLVTIIFFLFALGLWTETGIANPTTICMWWNGGLGLTIVLFLSLQPLSVWYCVCVVNILQY